MTSSILGEKGQKYGYHSEHQIQRIWTKTDCLVTQQQKYEQRTDILRYACVYITFFCYLKDKIFKIF